MMGMETPLVSAHYAFVRNALQFFPEGAFEVISEEINSLTLISEETEEETARQSQSQSQSQTSEMDDFNGVTVFIGQEQYKIETTVLRWSPYDRVFESDNLFVSLFSLPLLS